MFIYLPLEVEFREKMGGAGAFEHIICLRFKDNNNIYLVLPTDFRIAGLTPYKHCNFVSPITGPGLSVVLVLNLQLQCP